MAIKPALVLLITLASLSLSQELFSQESIQLLPVSYTDGNNSPTDSVSNSNNELFVVGAFYLDNDFGGISATAVGAYNTYLAKYNSNLDLMWLRTISGSNNMLNSVALDSEGNILAAGYFQESINIDGVTLTTANSSDALLVKYSPTGSLLWAKQYGSGMFEAKKIAIGQNSLALCIEGGGIIEDVQLNGDVEKSDVALLSLNLDGSVQWMHYFGGIDDEECGGIVVESNDNKFLALNYKSASLNISDQTTAAGNGDWNFLLTRFSDAGQIASTLLYSTSAKEYVSDLALDPTSGDIFAVGYFSNGSSISDSQLKARPPRNNAPGDIFTARISTQGNFVWTRVLAGPGNDLSKSICVKDNAIYISGTYSGTLNQTNVPNYTNGVVLAKYDMDGYLQLAHGFNLGTTLYAHAYVAVGSSKVFLAVVFNDQFENLPSWNGGSGALVVGSVFNPDTDA